MSEGRQRVTLQPAYVLHHYPYRDTSRLLELLTRDFGRVGVVARGARAGRSAYRGVLQPFRRLLVSWSARGDLGTLSAAELAGTARCVPAPRLYSGWYLNELILRLTRRHDPHETLFAHYEGALSGLAGEDSEARVLRVFEKRLLDTLGYGLELDRTLDGAMVRGDRNYEYRLEQGFVAAAETATGERVFAGESLLSLASERLERGVELDDARRLLQDVLSTYLGPRPLRVREVRRAMYRRRS